MAGPCSLPKSAIVPPGLHCILLLVLCSACGAGADGVRNRAAGPFPRAAIAESDGYSATVIPGGEYAAGRLRQFLVGEHYRDLWTTPVRVPVLNLSAFAGGLTPIRQGGGRQTMSLRLKARDGRQFVFRTVAKDQRNTLSEALRKTPIADIFQDQASSMNPAGALVVDELAHALGVFHAHPLLVLAPDDERLGEFRAAFAGRLGLLESYPTAGDAAAPETAAADKIVSTRKLFRSLEKDSEDRVSSPAYLTARLLDMLVGDWDRHSDQWRWARCQQQGRDVYYPLPRDRDQAFARLDGFFPRIAAIASVQMENFSENLDDIPSLMHTGGIVDRRILTDLDKTMWEGVAVAAVSRLTDEVIDNAVRRLPPPWYELSGAWLAAALKSRRDRLLEASAIYYSTLSRSVDIHLSDRPEHVAVERLDDRRVAVTVYQRDESSGGLRGGPVYERTFRVDETDEVIIHPHGGGDTVVDSGDAHPGLVVRVVVADSRADKYLAVFKDEE